MIFMKMWKLVCCTQTFRITSPIFCLIKTDREGQQQGSVGKCNVKRRLITKHKIQEFKVRLSQVDWSGIYISNDANTSYNHFIDLFMSVYNDCFSTGKSEIKKQL